jgi:hypothetical protein
MNYKIILAFLALSSCAHLNKRAEIHTKLVECLGPQPRGLYKTVICHQEAWLACREAGLENNCGETK